MKKLLFISSLISVSLNGPAFAEDQNPRLNEETEMHWCENGRKGIAIKTGWLDPFSDNERLYLDTILQDVSIQGYVGGFYTAPVVTVTIPQLSNALIRGMVVSMARFYSPEQDGWNCMDNAPLKITSDGRLITKPFGEKEVELATWNGTKLEWNDQYDVSFLLVKIRCKYENCSPPYSGGFHVGLRVREKL